MKDAEIKLRIGEIVKDREMSRTKLAESMDIGPAYLASVINSPDKSVSSRLLKAFTTIGVNVNWLITGIGNMYTGDTTGSLESWKKKAIENETTILESKKKLDRMAYLVEHLDSLLLSIHEIKGENGRNNIGKNKENS